MSVLEANGPGMPGDGLPEDGRIRLKKLRDRVGVLSRLAQPRTCGEARERMHEVRAEEFAVCLEWVAEQVDLVLQELSSSASRQADGRAIERDGSRPTEPERPDATDARFAFGVTLDQIDALDRVVRTISAHGDVVAAGQALELAGHTLPLIGQAICDGATAVRSILDEVEAQRLRRRTARPRTGVGETRGVYAAGFTAPVGVEASVAMRLPVIGFDRSRPARQTGQDGPRSRSLPDLRRGRRRSPCPSSRGPVEEAARGMMR